MPGTLLARSRADLTLTAATAWRRSRSDPINESDAEHAVREESRGTIFIAWPIIVSRSAFVNEQLGKACCSAKDG